jgi:hypothetical protein
MSSRGLAIADFWNEGRLSAVVNNMGDKPMLLVNLAPNDHHWLGVSLEGTQSNRDGIGARVTLLASGHSWEQELRSGSSYLSSSDLRLHFGLGPTASFERIEVVWPNGLVEEFPGGSADRFVHLVEGRGTSPLT